MAASGERIAADDAVYELPLPRTETFVHRIDNFSEVIEPVPFRGQIRCSPPTLLPACSRVAKWRLLMFPKGLQQEGMFAVFLDLENGGQQPAGYRCVAHFTLSLLEAVDAADNVNNNNINSNNSASDNVAQQPVAAAGKVFGDGAAKYTQKGHHEFRTGEWDRGFNRLFPLADLLQRRDEYLIDGAVAIKVVVDVRAEYVERVYRSSMWAMRPPCQDVVLQCPHCDTPFLVAAGNCLIFRHGVYKDTGMQVSPHASQETCERLVREDKIYGCGKPVQAVYDYEKKEWSSAKCGYV